MKLRPIELLPHFAAVLLVIVAATGADAGSARDEVWRSIFARPAPDALPSAAGVDSRKVELGRLLFFDTRLSGDLKRSCASCHDPRRVFTDGRARALGRDGGELARNTPTLLDLAWSTSFFLDGRAKSLEDQVRFPIQDRRELAGEFPAIVVRLASDDTVRAAFSEAFPDKVPFGESEIASALAAYERTLIAPETRFDRWVQGDDTALSDKEMQGFSLFVGRAGCVGCHGGWRFTDNSYHDIGLDSPDPGRGAVAGGVPGLAQFKTPGLRELSRTAPYMHDGSKPTLASVIEHYAGGAVPRPSLDAAVVRGLKLADGEKEALIAFLLTLSRD